MGVDEAKIMPFITSKLCNYNVCSLSGYKKELYDILYNEPDKIYEYALEYQKLYEGYAAFEPYQHSGNEWFYKGRMISHACGGRLNNVRYMYTNSREGLQYSFRSGFKLIECDIMQLNGELMAVHDFKRIYELNSGQVDFTLQTFREILTEISQHPDISLLVDVKWHKTDDFCEMLEHIERDIAYVAANDENKIRTLRAQLVMEVYNEETIKAAQSKGYECFFTQYRNADSGDFYNIVDICHRYGIKVIGMSVEAALANTRKLRIITDKNIHIFAFSTDSIDVFSALRKAGVTGVFTNYLTEKN